MNNLINLFTNTIFEKKLLLTRNIILLTISGGQDSFILFLFFLYIKKQFLLKIQCVYCQHFWQVDAFFFFFELLKMQYICQMKLTLNLSFVILHSEEKSRHWRYWQFSRLQDFYGLDMIASGHTQSDRIETFLFNLSRGCGVSSVAPISWKRVFRLQPFLCFPNNFQKCLKISSAYPKKKVVYFIRPILFLYRYEIFQLLKCYKFPLLIDRTNFQVQYFRNRIRYQLLPVLRFYLNPQIDLTLSRFLEIFFIEVEYLNFLKLKTLKKIQMNKLNDRIVSVNLPLFMSLPSNFQKHILLKILKHLKIKNLHFVFIENSLKTIILSSLQQRKIFLLKKNLILISYDDKFLIKCD